MFLTTTKTRWDEVVLVEWDEAKPFDLELFELGKRVSASTDDFESVTDRGLVACYGSGRLSYVI